MAYRILCSAIFIAFSAGTYADEARVTIKQVDEDGIGKSLGDITITESDYGLVFTPEIEGLSPGLHGFHVHQHGSCLAKKKNGERVAALAAGGHYAPHGATSHGYPWGDGHLGDLPALFVDQDGKASHPVLAPRIKRLAEIRDHALMIHAGGDNHADQPEKLGGGGARVACGVIK